MEEIKINFETDAVIVVDMLNDFCKGGALEVAGGDDLVGPINGFATLFRYFFFSEDSHPEGHVSYASRFDKEPFVMHTLLDGREQMLWPEHGKQGTHGAQRHPDIDLLLTDSDWCAAPRVCEVVKKGQNIDVDSYSGFRENENANGERIATPLAKRLRIHRIERIFVCGLARDYCDLWTALDGVDEGFEVFFLWDVTRAVNPDDDERVRSELEAAGVHIIDSTQLSV